MSEEINSLLCCDRHSRIMCDTDHELSRAIPTSLLWNGNTLDCGCEVGDRQRFIDPPNVYTTDLYVVFKKEKASGQEETKP